MKRHPRSTDISLLTAEQVSKILSVRPSTVYAAAAQGHLPAVRLWSGRRRSLIRFRRSDIEALIEQRSTEASSPSGSC